MLGNVDTSCVYVATFSTGTSQHTTCKNNVLIRILGNLQVITTHVVHVLQHVNPLNVLLTCYNMLTVLTACLQL